MSGAKVRGQGDGGICPGCCLGGEGAANRSAALVGLGDKQNLSPMMRRTNHC